MKAKELMIGDYVHHIEGAIVQVIDNLSVDGFVSQHGEVRVEYCNPIPLTDAICEKNGIRHQYGNPWYQYHFPYGNNDIEVHFVESMVNIKYVHELQHALRLYELADLADNFKIESVND